MTNPTGLGIDFAAIAGAETSAPKGASEAVLERVDLSQPLQKFSCRNGLSETEKMQLRAVAPKLYATFQADRVQLSNFGTGALDGLNSTVNNILEQQGGLRIPEVERITKEMAFVMKDFRRKYKKDDSQMLEALEKFADSIKGIFRSGRDFFERLYIDSQTAVKRLDGVAKELIEHKAILDLMSADAEAKKQELSAMPVGQSPERRKKEEELSVHLEMLEELEIRRSEYVQRLFVGFSTAPQIRNMRKVSNSLSQRLQLLISLTIPTMKLTIAQWGQLLQMDKAGHAIETVNDMHNAVLAEFAQASGETIPRLALLAQKPSTTPATIMALAQSIEDQHEGMIIAVTEGRRARAELDDTVVKAMAAINASTKKYQEKVIELVATTQQTAPLELTPAPELPEVVIEYAEQEAAKAA